MVNVVVKRNNECKLHVVEVRKLYEYMEDECSYEKLQAKKVR